MREELEKAKQELATLGSPEEGSEDQLETLANKTPFRPNDLILLTQTDTGITKTPWNEYTNVKPNAVIAERGVYDVNKFVWGMRYYNAWWVYKQSETTFLAPREVENYLKPTMQFGSSVSVSTIKDEELARMEWIWKDGGWVFASKREKLISKIDNLSETLQNELR